MTEFGRRRPASDFTLKGEGLKIDRVHPNAAAAAEEPVRDRRWDRRHEFDDLKREWAGIVGPPSDSFRNPTNNYVENISLAWLWCLLFGSFYFAFKGVWMHAILSGFLAIVTSGLSWLLYPIFARRILTKHYLRGGWIQQS
jgi:hypothetical protein